MKRIRQIGSFISLMLWSLIAYSAEPLILTDALSNKIKAIQLLDYSEVLQDEKGQLTLSEVLATKNEFKPVITDNGKLNFFLTHSAYWFRVTLYNQSNQRDWYFTMPAPISRNVSVFLSNTEDNHFVKQKLMKHSQTINYHLSLPKNTTHYHLYFRIQDSRAPLLVKPHLNASKHMLAKVMLMYPLYSLILGGLLTLAVYNLLYFFYLRDNSFLSLSVFIVVITLEITNSVGILRYFNETILQSIAMISCAFPIIAMIALISMGRNWLAVPKYLPNYDHRINKVYGLGVLLIPIVWLVNYDIVFNIIFGSIASLLLAQITVQRYKQGFLLPIMTQVGLTLLIVSLGLLFSHTISLIEEESALTNSIYVMLLLGLVILSLTQAEQIRIRFDQAQRISNANKARNEFLITKSHELRTPMNAVVNAGQLLALTPLSKMQQEYVTRLNLSSQHVLALINDVLDLARFEHSTTYLESSPFCLDEVVEKINQLLSDDVADKHLTLTLDNQLQLQGVQLLGDSARMQQALLNLIKKAITDTSNGTVSLTISSKNITDNHAEVLFEIKDEGAVLSKEQRDALFQAVQFKSDDSESRHNLSLGWAISQKLVQSMGGSINIRSRADKGNCIFFTLPFKLQDKEDESTEPETEDSLFSLSDMHILLVDDDEMNRYFGRELIGSLGAEVSVAEGGMEALSMMQSHHFDIVFMDVSMPEMDGYEATQLIRKHKQFNHIPVIALTAHAIAGERERCLSAGMDEYMTKPFEVDRLEKVAIAVRSVSHRNNS